MRSKNRPYVLFVAEIIYLKICEIKKKNPNFTNIEAIENFIGSELYKEIGSGAFHDKWLKELKDNKIAHMRIHPKSLAISQEGSTTF